MNAHLSSHCACTSCLCRIAAERDLGTTVLTGRNLLLSFGPYKFVKETYRTVQSILKTWSTYQLKDCCAVVQSCHLYTVATVGVLFSSCQRHYDFSAVGNYNQTSFCTGISKIRQRGNRKRGRTFNQTKNNSSTTEEASASSDRKASVVKGRNRRNGCPACK